MIWLLVSSLVILGLDCAIAADRFGWPDISHECGCEEILHLETAEFYRINMQCDVPKVCNRAVSCVYSSKAICLGRNEFVAGVSEEDGSIESICCEFAPLPDELLTFSCTTLPVADGEPAHMETYDPAGHPPPQQAQFVKAIVKQGDGISIVVCTPICKSTTTTSTGTTTHKPKKQPPKEEHEQSSSSASSSAASSSSSTAGSSNTAFTGQSQGENSQSSKPEAEQENNSQGQSAHESESSKSESSNSESSRTESSKSEHSESSTSESSEQESPSHKSAESKTSSTETSETSNSEASKSETSESSRSEQSESSSSEQSESTNTETSQTEESSKPSSTSGEATKSETSGELSQRGNQQATSNNEEVEEASSASAASASSASSTGSSSSSFSSSSSNSDATRGATSSSESSAASASSSSSSRTESSSTSSSSRTESETSSSSRTSTTKTSEETNNKQSKNSASHEESEEKSNVETDEDTFQGRSGGNGGGGGGCFSGDTTVQSSRGLLRMDELLVGDEVLTTIETSDGTSTSAFSPVRWFIHRRPLETFEFVTLVTATRSLSLTPDHLIPVVPCGFVDSSLVSTYVKDSRPSGSLQKGDCILTAHNSGIVAEKVSEIRREEQVGIYTPITQNGNIVVNDIIASCYSGSFPNHIIQHSAFKMIDSIFKSVSRILNFVTSDALDTSLTNSDGSIPTLLKFLLQASDLIH